MRNLKWKVPIIALAMGMLLSQCGREQIQGSLVGHSECKGTSIRTSSGSRPAVAQECLEYQYDGQGRLNVKHVDAAFNCCPGELSAEIVVTGSVITISEKESETGCMCNCLYDLDYQIENLESGSYLLRVRNPYQPVGEASLEVTIDLNAAPSGRFCVERNSYPWQ